MCHTSVQGACFELSRSLCLLSISLTLHGYIFSLFQCQAAASDLSVEQLAPRGDLDIPVITGLINTMEWLTDYNKFYERR